MESDVGHGAVPGDAGGCQNYSGMLSGRGMVLSLSFLMGCCGSWGLQQALQSSRNCSGVKTHLWPEEAASGRALLLSLESASCSFGLITGSKASMCFLSLILLEDVKLKPPIWHLVEFVVLLIAPKIKFHCTQFQS